MARILNIDTETGAVTIGMDNGGVRIVPIGEIDYDYPMVGDFVNVFERQGDVLVTKADQATSASTQQSWAQARSGAPGVPGAGQYYNPPQGKYVDKLAYVLLAVLLGSFGAHKFYAGKIGLGVLYACFFWTGIPGIAGLVEGIVGATKPQDPQGRIFIS